MGERQRYPLGFANNLRLNQDFPQPVFPSRFVLPGPLGTPDYDQAMRLATRRQETGSPMGSGLMSPVPPWWYQPRTKPKRKYKFPDNVPQGPIDEPLWLKFACNEERWDVHELPTWGHNHPRILAYINSVPYMRTTEYKYKHGRKMLGSGHMMGDLDETPWCACFVNWCLKKAGIKAPNYGRAKDWIKYGTVLEHKDVKRGAIAILYKKPEKKTANMTRSGWHVGFYLGGTPGVPVLLGGNQDNGVVRKPLGNYEAKNIYYRWPTEADTDGRKK